MSTGPGDAARGGAADEEAPQRRYGLDARSRTGRVREWIARLVEISGTGPPASVADFLAETLSKSDPPHLRSGIDGEEVATSAVGALKAILVRADRTQDDHAVDIKALVDTGVIKRTDMNAVEAVRFVREARGGSEDRGEARSRGAKGVERGNAAVVSMICAGMPVGHVDPDAVRRDPDAACELIASCRAAVEESLARISALEMFMGCASAGVGLDAETLLCPGHTGHELLQQAKEIVSQATGLPLCAFYDG